MEQKARPSTCDWRARCRLIVVTDACWLWRAGTPVPTKPVEAHLRSCPVWTGCLWWDWEPQGPEGRRVVMCLYGQLGVKSVAAQRAA